MTRAAHRSPIKARQYLRQRQISLCTNVRLVLVVALSFRLHVWNQHNATLGSFLKSPSMPLADCFLLLAVGAIPLVVLELTKLVRHARDARNEKVSST